MKKYSLIKKNSYYFLIFLACLSCKKQNYKENKARVASLPYYNEASFTPKWLSLKSKKLNDFHKISDFELVNQNGKKITQNTFKNKIYVADFFFTSCPGICPMMTSNMYKIQEEFKFDKDVMLLSHSVTPTIDSVQKLKEYALEKNIIDNKWHLVTGNKKQIYNFGRKSYFE